MFKSKKAWEEFKRKEILFAKTLEKGLPKSYLEEVRKENEKTIILEKALKISE